MVPPWDRNSNHRNTGVNPLPTLEERVTTLEGKVTTLETAADATGDTMDDTAEALAALELARSNTQDSLFRLKRHLGRR